LKENERENEREISSELSRSRNISGVIEVSSVDATSKAAQPETPTAAPEATSEQAPHPAPEEKLDLAGVFPKHSKFSQTQNARMCDQTI